MILLSTTSLVAAQINTCPAVVENALARASERCDVTGRNQACYGHVNVNAQPHEGVEAFRFERVGDIVDLGDIQSMRMSALDPENGIWGVALMRVQANLPSTIPGQNVTMVLFGDSEITNAVPTAPTTNVTVTSFTNAIVRARPTTNSAIVGSLPPGATLEANGRTPDNSWLRVTVPDEGSIGWMYRPLVTPEGDMRDLHVIDLQSPQYGPMQAFYLRTGIGALRCAELPTDGLLIQTPENAGAVEMVINEVSIEIGSTAYVTTELGTQLVVNLVEGAARVESNGIAQALVAGGRVRVPLNDDLAAAGPPSSFEPYDAEVLDDLPVQQLEQTIEVAPAVTEDEAALLQEHGQYFNLLALDDYDDLFDFLRERPNASDGAIVRYIEDQLGYVIVRAGDQTQVLPPQAGGGGDDDDDNGRNGNGRGSPPPGLDNRPINPGPPSSPPGLDNRPTNPGQSDNGEDNDDDGGGRGDDDD